MNVLVSRCEGYKDAAGVFCVRYWSEEVAIDEPREPLTNPQKGDWFVIAKLEDGKAHWSKALQILDVMGPGPIAVTGDHADCRIVETKMGYASSIDAAHCWKAIESDIQRRHDDDRSAEEAIAEGQAKFRKMADFLSEGQRQADEDL